MSDQPFDYWRFFAADARKTGSELYARISDGVAGDEGLKALAARAKPGQPHANLLLGAVHYLLLRGAEHPLKRLYPDLGGNADTGEDPFPLFKDFVETHQGEIIPLVETRITNTNEVGRSAMLHPGFRMLPGGPLHLIEIGPSAGLNMIWDRYGVRYMKDGAVAASIAPDAPMVIDCEARGDKLPPTGPTPLVASRVGLELNPVDLSKPEDRDWLRALMWPDQIPRLLRLERAIDLFEKVNPPILTGDAITLMPDALAAIPAGGTVCIYHTIVLYQVDWAMREVLNDMLVVAGLRRPVYRLSFEFDGRECVLSLIHYHDGARDERLLAHAHPHGTWIEWMA
jgi:hypothetical protein